MIETKLSIEEVNYIIDVMRTNLASSNSNYREVLLSADIAAKLANSTLNYVCSQNEANEGSTNT